MCKNVQNLSLLTGLLPNSPVGHFEPPISARTFRNKHKSSGIHNAAIVNEGGS
jgi:hypothetical protein